MDGRNPGVSEGMSIKELADFAIKRLGATWGVTLDSGGSSTMVIDGVVVNNTDCNYNDCRSQFYWQEDISIDSEFINLENFELLGNRGFHEQLVRQKNSVSQYDPNGADLISLETVEPPVANSFMMISILPKENSNSFSNSELVNTKLPSSIRLGPGDNYSSLGEISAGQQGSILEHANGLNGVFATGSYWWKSEFGDMVGWIRQIDLTFTPADWQYLPMISNQE